MVGFLRVKSTTLTFSFLVIVPIGPYLFPEEVIPIFLFSELVVFEFAVAAFEKRLVFSFSKAFQDFL